MVIGKHWNRKGEIVGDCQLVVKFAESNAP